MGLRVQKMHTPLIYYVGALLLTLLLPHNICLGTSFNSLSNPLDDSNLTIRATPSLSSEPDVACSGILFSGTPSHLNDYILYWNEEDTVNKIREGVSPHTPDMYGRYPIQDAVKYEKYEVIKELSKYKINLEVRDGLGKTPLMNACAFELSKMVDLLLSLGGNPNARDSYGNTPVLEAAQFNKWELIESLISKGADLHALNKISHNALMIASRAGKPKTISYLLNRGFDVNSQDRIKNTPIFFALQSGKSLSGIELLLSKSPKLNIRNGMGQTPLTLAIKLKDQKVMELLLSHGADINYQDGSGKTALTHAIQQEDLATVKYLVAFGAKILDLPHDSNHPLAVAGQVGNKEIYTWVRECITIQQGPTDVKRVRVVG